MIQFASEQLVPLLLRFDICTLFGIDRCLNVGQVWHDHRTILAHNINLSIRRLFQVRTTMFIDVCQRI